MSSASPSTRRTRSRGSSGRRQRSCATAGLIVYPTDSCYALGCALDAAGAVARLRALRGIDDRHHLSIVCRDLAQAGRYVRLDNWQFRVVRQGVPGPYTFVLPATREVPRRLKHAKRGTLGVRVPRMRSRRRWWRSSATRSCLRRWSWPATTRR
jgi:tRNA threonylcarbamoyl adenosine modification protein (Sua5/YciO/YrdC/YwlC family)